MADKSDILQKISEAEMILIGVGEEFDDSRALKKEEGYKAERESLLYSKLSFLLPAYQKLCRERIGSQVYEVLCGLAKLVADKNYFVVATSTNDVVEQVSWREGRLVTPCGGSRSKQCTCGCEEGLVPVENEDTEIIKGFFNKEFKAAGEELPREWDYDALPLGRCPKCNAPLVLNNIYAENYDEKGYLKQWELYTRWLQGTLNKRLLILELGVGMQFPSVIRWPFEKIAYFNQKAEFYRVNEKLYQLSEDLKEKGTSISENAIDWLRFLC